MIDPKEVYDDLDSIRTIIDGKRDLAFITLISKTQPKEAAKKLKIAKDAGLKILRVKGNPYEAVIIYTPNSTSKALELKKIAEKHGGYLPSREPKEDVIKIGRLLGYDEENIQNFVNRPYIQEIKDGVIIREFSNQVKSDELKWHRDELDREVTILEGKNWYYQEDNKLPILLKEGDTIFIPKQTYHRIKRGDTPLKIQIKENG